MQSAQEKPEMRTKFLLLSLKGRHDSENLGADGRIILKYVLRKYNLAS
jgi:hypothetical protein